MAPDVGWVIVKCHDPERLAAFWSELLGVGVSHRVGPYVFLERTPAGTALGFHRDDDVAPPGRMHLDVQCPDLTDAVTRVRRLGGARAPGYEDGGFLVMRDPEGNEFCLLPRSAWLLDDDGRAHYEHPPEA
jgi:predicted enzyme related to lactoylglutathione lyase